MNIILFDGECNLCDFSVQFIIKRDKQALYHFTSKQSDVGQQLLKKHRIPADLDSFILVEGEKCFYKSTAALRVCRNLEGGWKLLHYLIITPKPLRDYVYGMIAKNRYKWFGKKNSCILPSPDLTKRFL
ncbi:thiol-disulfide oxidoreductase DCC family protein [Niallia oryzisoli]|uniref:thiol-disulfide oxidoreductase DCC family protein n=1 Tax=Niallia oryzisoli TaxID=1737571 RepID=UPI003735C688